MRRIFASMALAGVATVGLLSGTTAGAAAPSDSCTFSVTTEATGGAGSPLKVTVTGVAPANQTVKIFVAEPPGSPATEKASTTSDSNGAFSVSFNYSANGPFTVEATYAAYGLGKCETGAIVVNPLSIAFTGSDTTKPGLVLGLSAIAIGAILVVAARRRRAVGVGV